MENTFAPSVEPVSKRSQEKFDRKTRLVLWGSFLLGALYTIGHESFFFSGNTHLPGIGLMASTWIFLGLCIVAQGTMHLRNSWFPLICTLLLSATYGLYANNSLRLMNLPVLIGLIALTAFSLSGSRDLFSAQGLSDSLRRLFKSPWPQFAAPFRALTSSRKLASTSTLRAIALGLILCIPVVGLVLILLCDADSEFGATIINLFTAFNGEKLAKTLWNLLRFAFLSLLLFAFIHGLNRWLPRSHKKQDKKFNPLSLCVLLFALCGVYAAFLYIQLKRLFHQLPQINYAASARAGFFQLVLVALITLLVALPAVSLYPTKPGIRLLSALSALLTMGITATALCRMLQYIQAYGWTLLRAVTLWGFLAIAAAIVALLIKCLRPSLCICRALTLFILTTWVAFNCVNIDAQIVQANLTAYERGTLQELDVAYLSELSPDVLPALRSLKDDKYQGQIRCLEVEFLLNRPNWYDWSLSWAKVNQAAADDYVGDWQLSSVDGQKVFPAKISSRQVLRIYANGTGLFLEKGGSQAGEFRWAPSNTGLIIYASFPDHHHLWGMYFRFSSQNVLCHNCTLEIMDLSYTRTGSTSVQSRKSLSP